MDKILALIISGSSLIFTILTFIIGRRSEHISKMESAKDPFGIDELSLISQNTEISAEYKNAAKIELNRKLKGLDLRAEISRLDEIDETVKDHLRINQKEIAKIKNSHPEDGGYTLSRFNAFYKPITYHVMTKIYAPLLILFIIGSIAYDTNIATKLIYILVFSLAFFMVLAYSILCILKIYNYNYNYIYSIDKLTKMHFKASWWQSKKISIGRACNANVKLKKIFDSL
ncbi:Uncharacterised protein [Mycobacteroides abscessus subsp. abscessus]|nr:Uncharacterised protein [Mycobacteroides abscessus subsp. abscessus]